MHSPRAQCDKKAYQFLAKLTVERQENLTLRQEMAESIVVEGGRVGGRRAAGAACAIGPGPSSSPPARFCRRSMHTGEVKTPGGRGGDAAAVGLSAKPALARLRARAVQDRHAAATERPHDRLSHGSSPSRATPSPVPFSFLTDAIDAAPARLPYHLHQPRGPRPDPGQPAPRTDVLRPDPEHGPALLPVDRRQGRPVRRPREPPDLPRARRAEHARILLQRHLDQPAARRSGGDHPADPGARARRDHAVRLRGRVRLRPADPAPADARDQAGRRPVLRRPDQRHDRLRGSRRPGAHRRHQRRARGQGTSRRSCSIGRGPTSAS